MSLRNTFDYYHFYYHFGHGINRRCCYGHLQYVFHLGII